MKLYLVEYTADNIIRNMIVRAKNYNAAETQVTEWSKKLESR
ncbi:hypothetical protein ACTQXV_01275 [Ligilactobacillus salivarius]